jgi:hypothetical protein
MKKIGEDLQREAGDLGGPLPVSLREISAEAE